MIISYNLEQLTTIPTIALLNPGLNYGDGIFETVMTDQEGVKYLQEHLDRLRKGLNALGLSITFSDLEIKMHIQNLLQENQNFGLLKIYAWRKSSTAFKNLSDQTDLTISWVPRKHLMSPITSANIYQSDHFYDSEVSRFKSLSSMRYVLAGLHCKRNKLDTCIILNKDHYITETLTANLFWIIGTSIFTPSLSTGCIEGIMRNEILELIPCEEGRYSLQEIQGATCVFSSNSGGIQYIESIGDSYFSTNHPIVEELKLELY
jgi:branched-subunit amino acid aminotransferase/4-amino-4-deoxychorismate lyase